MKKKEALTKETIAATVAEAKEKGKFNRTVLTVDFMDAYVAAFAPDTIETWVDKCLAVPMTKRKIGGVEKDAKDITKLREIFLEDYFPDYTDEAIEKQKEEKKKAKAKAKEEKEALKNLSAEEKFKQRMEKLKDEYKD